MWKNILAIIVFALQILFLILPYVSAVKEIEIMNSSGPIRVKTDTDIGGIIMCTFPEDAPPFSYVLCAIYSFICLVAFVLGGYFYFKGKVWSNALNEDRQDTLI